MSEITSAPAQPTKAKYVILASISFCHLLNDMIQALLPAVYPILKGSYHLSFGQIGSLTLIYQITASLLQPLVGFYTDRNPHRYALASGMVVTILGLFTLAYAPDYLALLAGAAMLGIGSAIYHPEASRITRLASGDSHGMAQSLFQVGGSFGSSLGPLLAAFFILPRGQNSVAWFALVALGGMGLLTALGNWYMANRHARIKAGRAAVDVNALSTKQVGWAITVLLALIFSKYFYLSSITSYYIFYLIQRFDLTTETSQLYLFVFLAASAAGTFVGGPIGDRFGLKAVIWTSILGALPFTLLLPYVGLGATIGLSVVIGLVLSSAFSAIVVYAQELMPNRVGMVSGVFFGFAFGMGGIGAAALGALADRTDIGFVYRVCSLLPMIGLLAAFLPNISSRATSRADL